MLTRRWASAHCADCRGRANHKEKAFCCKSLGSLRTYRETRERRQSSWTLLYSVGSAGTEATTTEELRAQAQGSFIQEGDLGTLPPGSQTAEPYITHSWMWRGHKIQYATAGCGKPVVLVHGFGASIGHWRKNIPMLAQTHKVYALDLLGFGMSDKPPVAYTMELWQEQVTDFLAEFVQEPAVLVGNSLGSLTCLMVNAAAPEGTVSGTVLLNCAVGMNNKAASDDWRVKLALPGFLLIDFLLKQPRIARYLFDSFRSPGNIREVLLRVYGDQEAVDDALVQLICNPTEAEGALEAFVSIITGPPGPRPESLVEQVKGPLLIMWGDKDPFTPVDGPVGRFFLDYEQSCPTCDFHMLPDTGHCPHDDRPHLVNEKLAEWLSRHH